MSLVGLGDLLRGVPDEAFAALSEPQGDALEISLLRRPPEGRRPDPRAVSVAALALLEGLARVGPVLIAVDDEQWLDSATERVMTFVARRLSNGPVGFLVTRSDPGAPTPLGLADAVEPGRFLRLPLGPMPPDELAAMIRDRVGVAMSVPRPGTSPRLGNPLRRLEIAQARLGRRGRDWAGAPDSQEPP
jgi:hypothetical protein